MVALDVDATTVVGPWFRHVPSGVDPGQRPEPAGDNRWQHGRVVDAIYLADSTACAWAEWYRHLAEAGVPPTVAMPRDLWRYEVAPLGVADLSDAGRLARVGLPLPRPGRRGWGAFQELGEQLHREDWLGLLAPSAARPASRVLALFLHEAGAPPELTAIEQTHVTHPPAPPTGMHT